MKRNGCIENNGSAVSPMEWLACVLYARVVTHAKPRWLHTREHAAAAAATVWKFVSGGVTTGSIASCSSKHLHTYHRGRCTRRLSVTATDDHCSIRLPHRVTHKLGLHIAAHAASVCVLNRACVIMIFFFVEKSTEVEKTAENEKKMKKK